MIVIKMMKIYYKKIINKKDQLFQKSNILRKYL